MGCQCRQCKRFSIRWKTSAEIRAAGEHRCRIQGCGVPLSGNPSPYRHPGSCGNHDIDNPRNHGGNENG